MCTTTIVACTSTSRSWRHRPFAKPTFHRSARIQTLVFSDLKCLFGADAFRNTQIRVNEVAMVAVSLTLFQPLSTCLTLSRSSFPPSLFMSSARLPLTVCLFLSVCLSVSLICLIVCLSVSLCLSASLSFSMSVCLCSRLSPLGVCLSLCLSVSHSGS